MTKAPRQAAWEYFGDELRRLREEAGLTQAELGEHVFVSGAYIGLFEHARRKPQLDVAQRLDTALRTGGVFERMWHTLIRDTRYAPYFEKAAELEQLATRICDFASGSVPGLLQTAAYARAITVASNPFAPDEYIEEKVRARIDRGALLKGDKRPTYWAVLHESVLRVAVGGSAAMARQLDHILALRRQRTIVVQVLPFSAGGHPLMGKMLRLMDFEDAPPTAYTEAVYSGNLLDDPAMVKQAQDDYDLIRAAALSPEASLPLIESAAEDHRSCASTT
ncbi:helix-turn-helix domain-containing protein [Streptomyces sp. KLOTTS4A1]|uniref:helix-turn-helix domain-containing protein n=1 Tax=Streptomyces sp. KLOTTS4A1 TaxID=3390996 RepID=UPI0039F58458